ncbi:UDP-glucose dehydrogenase family protein [Microvirga arabica]|uniref:UDP-glucose 6-dehydrogenase n=1 Tax=Microvirga arabica TaxID=1128671 RepID=A0ABV6YDW1_9HYPH
MMRLAVIGTGYVGLVSGACFAEKGHTVVCVDVDPAKVAMVNCCKPPIYEDGLQELLDRNVPARLSATTDLREAILTSDVSLIAVGTPFDGEEIDLSYIVGASQQIGRALAAHEGWHTVIVKSTVVPGTTEDVVLPILERESGRRAGHDFGVGMNPEFLKEGEAIADFMSPDRIVIGGIDERSIRVQRELYQVFPEVAMLETTPRTAEMIKYTANSLLATLISFSNEIGNLSAAIGVDVAEAMRGVHLDKRLTPFSGNGDRVKPGLLTYLAAGCGFGGSCFPKDVKALVAHGRRAGASMDLLQSVIEVNRRQPGKMIDLLRRTRSDLNGARISVLGVAFKPGTDDVRESPSLSVIQSLIDMGALVTVYDPVAQHEAERLFGSSIAYAATLAEAVSNADAILVMTAWPEFRQLPLLIERQVRTPFVIDGRRILDKFSVPAYAGIGLPFAGAPTADTYPEDLPPR